MKTVFYTYNGERLKLKKTLTNGKTFNVLLKSGTDKLINLDIALSIEDDTDFKSLNYCYIEDLKRYYFVDNINMYRNKYFILSLKEDILMSFQNDILNATVEVTESDNIFNDDKNDYTAKNNYERIEYNFNSPFTDDKQIVLIGV